MKENSAPKNRLKELRDRSRLTMEEVSLVTGFGVPTISRHESGGRALSQEAVLKYASLYKVHTYEIYYDPKDVTEDD